MYYLVLGVHNHDKLAEMYRHATLSGVKPIVLSYEYSWMN